MTPASLRHAAALMAGLAFASALIDAQRTPRGTSSVAGVVVTAGEPPAPVRRAVVRLEHESGATHAAVTDDAGRFALANLPAGRYRLVTSRAGFVDAEHGALRPGRLGRPLALGAAQTVTDVVLHMSRGAVISGRVVLRSGEPVVGIPVLVHPSYQMPSRLGSRNAQVVTDDQGRFRAFGLTPGRYVVVALPGSEVAGDIRAPASTEIDRLLQELRQGPAPGVLPARPAPEPAREAPQRVTWAPVYHPETANRADAGVIAVTAGEERDNVDITLAPVPATRIEGVVVNPGGALDGIQLSISGAHAPVPLTTNAATLTQRPGPDGRFLYTNVSPGDYTVVARVLRPEPLFALADVRVSGADVEGLTLILRPGLRLSGQAEFAGEGPPPVDDFTKLRVSIVPRAAGGSAAINATIYGRSFGASGQFQSDGSFEVSGLLPGEYRPSVTLPGDGSWWLRSVMVDGRDLLDTPLVFRSNDIAGATLTFTNRRAELSGRIQAAGGQPAVDYHVVLISAEPDHWLPDARRTRATRPDDDGRFLVDDLPGGAYLLIALDDLDARDLDDPAFLTEIAAGGIRVEVPEGARVGQDVRIAR